jgi:hypothetical protein
LGLLPGTLDLRSGPKFLQNWCNTIFHDFDNKNPRYEQTDLENMQKESFGEGQVQDPIPALPGLGTKILALLLEDKQSED